MFDVGSYIVCGNNGVCKVEKIGPLDMVGISKEKRYYTLLPCYSQGSTVFTPVDNEKVLMRPVLDKEEVKQLIEEIADIEAMWIPNEKAREMQYKEAIRTCDPRELVKIIKTIYVRKQSRMAEGKKVTFIDDKYYKMAEDNLYGEIAISMGMSREEAKEYVEKKVEALAEELA